MNKQQIARKLLGAAKKLAAKHDPKLLTQMQKLVELHGHGESAGPLNES